MAASKDPKGINFGDEGFETKDEPTRAELKSMIVDIQISISSILMEHKKTRKEMAELKETVLEQKTEIASLDLKATLASINPILPGLFLSAPLPPPPSIDLEKYSGSCDETWHVLSTSLA